MVYRVQVLGLRFQAGDVQIGGYLYVTFTALCIYNPKIPYNPDNRYRLTTQSDDKCGRVMVLCVGCRARIASATTDCQGLTDAATPLHRNTAGNGFILWNCGVCTVSRGIPPWRWRGALSARPGNGRQSYE